MKRFLLMFMTLGLITGSVATAEATEGSERTERTVEGRYYGAQLLYEYRSCALSGGAGCVTVQTLAHEGSLTAKVTDAHGQPVIVRVVDASTPQDGLTGRSEVYGTFCGETTEPIRFEPGTTLEFWVGVGEWWPPTWWIVPSCQRGAATTGNVSVTLSGWTTPHQPPTPAPGPAESPAPQSSPSGQSAAVERSVDLVLRRHLRGTGSVVAADASCSAAVPVVIQRKTSDAWLEIASTTTDAEGAFAMRLRDRAGRYRAVTPEAGNAETTCLTAVSAAARHRH